MKTFGKRFFGKEMELNTEVTNGTCPIFHETTIFVSIFSHVYRCITCGADTIQKVNGVIQFMPIAHAGVGEKPVMKLIDEDGAE